MESRIRKNLIDEANIDNKVLETRSSRNAKLYRDVYGDYDELDNLPVEDNINEIDIKKLRELVLGSEQSEDSKQIKENLNILEQKKRIIDEQKIYDINKILEKAKYENNKLKEPPKTTSSTRSNLLTTLGSKELSLEEINEAKKIYQEQLDRNKHLKDLEEALETTRELKFKDINKEETETKSDESINTKNIFDTNSLSLDLFGELKPTENTIITKPIVMDEYDETKYKNKPDLSDIKSDIHSGDTRDIDIIKDPPPVNQGNNSNEFFTNVYEFSKSDFAESEEEFFETPKSNGIFKIFLLILAIIIVIGVIIYFVGTYGLGTQ